MTIGYDWTEERIEQLKYLCTEEGMSFSQIAREMGCVSRNVPLCKFNRLRIKDPTLRHKNGSMTNLNKLVGARVKVVKSPTPKPIVPKLTDIVPLQLDGLMITTMNVERDMCRYPHGDPTHADFHYCGNAPKRNSSYCEAHHKLCRTPNEPRKRAA